MLIATLGGVEMSLGLSGVPHRTGGVQAAMQVLAAAKRASQPAEASAHAA